MLRQCLIQAVEQSRSTTVMPEAQTSGLQEPCPLLSILGGTSTANLASLTRGPAQQERSRNYSQITRPEYEIKSQQKIVRKVSYGVQVFLSRVRRYFFGSGAGEQKCSVSFHFWNVTGFPGLETLAATQEEKFEAKRPQSLRNSTSGVLRFDARQ